MRVYVTGATGQLGTAVMRELKERGTEAYGGGSRELDITDASQTFEKLKEIRPDGVIHCASYTRVDAAEQEQEMCYRVNVVGTRNVAAVCAELGAKLLVVSTDYVFDGSGENPRETEDFCNPLNYYGYTKVMAERIAFEHTDRVFIARTEWLYSEYGANFVKTMLELSEKHKQLKVVSDQIGVPTYAGDLAVLLCDMIQTEKYGKYHTVNEGFCSKYELVCELMKLAGRNVQVMPALSSDFQTAAKRPENSRLSTDSVKIAGFRPLPDWRESLIKYLRNCEIIAH